MTARLLCFSGAGFTAELSQEADGPAGTETDEEWRRSLMTVGHDPLRLCGPLRP